MSRSAVRERLPTVKKMLRYSAPPGYRRTKPVRRPKLDGFTGIIDAVLEADADPEVPRKQPHTAHRIFERLRDERGFAGGYTVVKGYVRARRQPRRARRPAYGAHPWTTATSYRRATDTFYTAAPEHNHAAVDSERVASLRGGFADTARLPSAISAAGYIE